MKKKFKSVKRIVSFLLALVITASTLMNDALTIANADETSAMERVTNFINLAANKQTKSLDGNLTLTTDELRFLGVYISNFYIPFCTELGVGDQDKEDGKKRENEEKEAMIEALANGLNFKKETASTLVDKVIGLSRSNNKELQVRVSNDWHKNYKKIPSFSLNYYTFLQLMSGGSLNPNVSEAKGTDILGLSAFMEDSLSAKDTTYNDFFLNEDNKLKYKYAFFGYESGGEFIPVFDCGIDGKTITPSMVAFTQCLNSVDWENGYGFNMFDYSSKKMKNLETLHENLNNKSDEIVYKTSAYGAKMVVDCFGNIIIMGGNHQYVAVPGCMNPYTWVSVDSDGKDIMSAGNYYNVITFQGMSLADADKLVSGSGEKKSDTKDKNALWFKFKANGDFVEKTKDKTKSASYNPSEHFAYTFKGIPLRLMRGSAESELDNSNGNGGDGNDLIMKAEKGADKTSDKGPWYWEGFIGGLHSHADSWDSVDTCLNDYILIHPFVNPDKKIKVINKLAYINNLGLYGFSDPNKDIDYEAIQYTDYLNSGGTSANKYFQSWSEDSNNGFTNLYKDLDSGKINTKINVEANTIVSVYTTYAIAGLYKKDDESKKNSIGQLGYRINKSGLPKITKDPIDIAQEVSKDEIEDSIKNWIYYLLHPTEGFNYVRLLITNKVNAILVGWHNDMVGTEGVGAITGTTKYRNNIGYVTTPDLSEIEWTAKLLNLYNNAIPFLIVIMIVTMLFAYITGIMSIQRCALGVLIFACFLLVPVNAINGVVGASNRVSQNLYGEKFTYWALVQQESYATQLDEAATQDSYSNYLKTLYASNNAVYSNQGSDSIVLKWQAPKKMASLMLSESDTTTTNSLSDSKLLGYVLNRDAFSGETYLDQDSTYLYRSYTDLGNFSRFVYNGIDMDNQPSRSIIDSGLVSNTKSSTNSAIMGMAFTYAKDRDAGYTNVNKNGSNTNTDAIRVTTPFTSEIYNDALAKKDTVKDMTINDYVGIRQDVFNFSVAMFNNSSEDYKDNLLVNCNENSKEELETFLNNYTDEDLTGLAAYSLMSESPYYYFSWDLYDSGMSTTANATNGYKSLLLGQEEGGFFYNVEGNGELKDFMDMKSLFTYTIPYLKEGNDIVKEWDEIYGTEIYDGVPTDEGHWGDSDISNSTELQQKYWHNLNVARLYEIYTPWVDLMYDCSYAEPETINVFGEKIVIQDPINPASYPDDRPMIFSESEMLDYGLEETDLTKVEKLILEFNKGAEERMYNLLNYYNFSDVTLNTAAAMECTFEFNITFSENGIFKDNINLYPKSFELANFSYDAFLRLILSNSTGADISSKDDFYMTIIQNSSTTTAIVMLVLDLLSQYVLPAFKLFFLIAVFISVILLVVATAFKVDPEQKFIKVLSKGIFVPMISFLIINVLFSWIVSLFMGVGNNAVTETQTASISMGDPVTVMLALAALDIIVVIIYFKILKGIIKDIKSNFKMISNFMGGVFGGALFMAGGISKGASRGAKSFAHGVRRVSSRAATRASIMHSNYERKKRNKQFQKELEENRNRRINDTKRSTVSNKDALQNEKFEKIMKDSIDKKTIQGIYKMQQIQGKTTYQTQSGAWTSYKNSNTGRTRDTSNKVKDSGRHKK